MSARLRRIEQITRLRKLQERNYEAIHRLRAGEMQHAQNSSQRETIAATSARDELRADLRNGEQEACICCNAAATSHDRASQHHLASALRMQSQVDSAREQWLAARREKEQAETILRQESAREQVQLLKREEQAATDLYLLRQKVR